MHWRNILIDDDDEVLEYWKHYSNEWPPQIFTDLKYLTESQNVCFKFSRALDQLSYIWLVEFETVAVDDSLKINIMWTIFEAHKLEHQWLFSLLVQSLPHRFEPFNVVWNLQFSEITNIQIIFSAVINIWLAVTKFEVDCGCHAFTRETKSNIDFHMPMNPFSTLRIFRVSARVKGDEIFRPVIFLFQISWALFEVIFASVAKSQTHAILNKSKSSIYVAPMKSSQREWFRYLKATMKAIVSITFKSIK